MFTGKPSPFKPNSDRGWPATAIVIALFAGLSVYTYIDRVTPHSEANSIASRSLPTPPAATSKASDQAAAMGQWRGTTPVAPNPESTTARGQPSNVNSNARTTVYLCKAYSGGTFWSDMTCSAQGATVDRMTTVPASLPFEQQVAIARGEAQEAAKLYEAPKPVRAAAIESAAPARNRPLMCDVYDQQVRDLDAEARRPLPAFRQDQIRADRMNVMAARARERC